MDLCVDTLAPGSVGKQRLAVAARRHFPAVQPTRLAVIGYGGLTPLAETGSDDITWGFVRHGM